MDLTPDNWDFYGLVTNLCTRIFSPSLPEDYADKQAKLLKKTRRKAFEILLKKNPDSNYNAHDLKNDTSDPLTELLKHAFVLRSTFGHASSAAKLENALDELQEEPGAMDASLKSVLVFLNCMKAYETSEKNDLNIFHFGDKNPALPEPETTNKIPEYQIYPSSAFHLPYRIEDTTNNLLNFSTLSINPPFSFPITNDLHLSNNEFSRIFSLTSVNPMLMSSPNCYLVDDEETSENCWNEERAHCEIISPSHQQDSVSVLDVPWILGLELAISENKNWENLGSAELPECSTFILESEDAIHHLQNFRQWSFNETCERNQRIPLRLSTREFTENVKLVLLGIESDCFIWNARLGFIFKSAVTVPRLSSEALKDICSEITHWSTCFKLLSLLTRPGPDSNGRMREEGLIFRAMCTSINEILIHYQAVILQVFGDNSTDLLSLLQRLKPIGCLISEVAKLCRCDNIRQTILGEGIGLLSHIYKQVTKITKPTIALVYYSVLKSCCEIYFEFLEKWIFEGKCDEGHGEFMIKIRPQYLRTRGHKFWSKCFGINRESVPGFLENLTESILQCGKAVRLLKICHPKDPMCTLFSMSHPTVKVCLNVNMLSEQEEICQEYMSRGIEILGNITLSTALQQMRLLEKEKAMQVMAAQAGSLQRIKRSQEEAKQLLVKNKRELLANLKFQAEEAALRREKAREAKIIEEKLMLEKRAAEEEEEKRLQIADAKITIDYYKELAAEAKKRKRRALWRTRRMALFDERVELIVAGRQEESTDSTTEDNRMESGLLVERDENSNSSEERSQTTPGRAPRPTDLSLKDTSIDQATLSLDPISLTTEAILDEITENDPRFRKIRAGFVGSDPEKTDNSNFHKLEDRENSLDKEGNERAAISKVNLNDSNEDKKLSSENLDNLDYNSKALDNQLPNLQNSDINDATPMSCTTDSYLQSVASSSQLYNCLEVGSFSGSKNDFETPMTPDDCLKPGINQNLPESQSFFSGFGGDNAQINFESSLTMADVELIDNTSLQIYLEKSVMVPLIMQSRLANAAVVKCLIEEHKILSHFQSLRSFFFLLNGEFAKTLTGALFRKFYEISLPIELFNSATLTNLLENAIHSSLTSSYVNAELLSLSASEVPTLLTVSNPEALDCLCLNYKVSWPLNIILDEMLMQQYSKVFKFLVMTGRVLWVLQEDFNLLKLERKAALSPQYHRIQLFRHAMMQFMTAFSNYLTCSVLHASWTEFEKDLENSTTLDEIYAIHVSYIKKILSRCMLTTKAEKLRQCLLNIFKIILKFHNCLRSHEWNKTTNNYTITNYKKLEQMYEAFCDLRTYPVHVVEKLASTGYQSHLTHFLDSLNINPLYNLSTKGV